MFMFKNLLIISLIFIIWWIIYKNNINEIKQTKKVNLQQMTTKRIDKDTKKININQIETKKTNKDIKIYNYKYIIPWYWWSYDLNKKLLLLNNHSSIVIVNPNNWDINNYEDVFNNEINNIQKNNNLAIWYIYTTYWKRQLSDVKLKIDNWLKYYPKINWFFIDEVWNSIQNLNYYTEIFNYIKKKNKNFYVVLNPWINPPIDFFKIADNIVIYENPCNDFKNYTIPDYIKSIPKEKISLIWYECNKNQINELSTKYKDYSSYFTTDWKDWNPWDSLEKYVLEKK